MENGPTAQGDRFGSVDEPGGVGHLDKVNGMVQGTGATGVQSWTLRGRFTRGATGAAALLAVLALTACSDADDSPIVEIPTPVETSTPVESEPSPTQTPEAVETPDLTPEAPIDRTDTEYQIFFEDLPEVTGDLREALDAYTLFELESTRSTINGAVSPILTDLAEPHLIQDLQRVVDINIAGEWTIDGPATIRILDIAGAAARATVDSCLDGTQMRLTSPEESVTAEELGLGTDYVRTDLFYDGSARWLVVEQHVLSDRTC